MNPKDNSFTEDGQSLSEQAAYWWFVVRDAECTPEERRAFADWVKRSPQHIDAFLRVSGWSQRIKTALHRWPHETQDELITRLSGAESATANVVALNERMPSSPAPVLKSERTDWRKVTHAVAALAAVLLLAVGIWIVQRPNHYQTAVGEQRSVLLDDGSLVTLNTDSAIEVKYRSDHRSVRLLRGEALFKVAHDTHRPFDVLTDHAAIRAVGTQFNVDRHLPGTTVSVLEGRVRVSVQNDAPQPHWVADRREQEVMSAKFVDARQQVSVLGGQLGSLNTIADLQAVVAWTQRQIAFEGEPLQTVADQFNRYNLHHIVIEAPELRDKQVTGVFQANDADSFLAFIAAIPGTEVLADQTGNHLVRLKAEK